MKDVIIIGAGPAGMAAGIYAVRAGMDCLLIEQMPLPGGQVVNTYEVDNYPGLPGISGMDLSDKFSEHAEKLNVPRLETRALQLIYHNGDKTITGEAVANASAIDTGDNGVEEIICEKYMEVITSEGTFLAKTVILATGASYRHLGVPGEKEYSGAGVSYCATCDGAFFRGRTVAVVGGGDVAVEDAIFLARGCKKVYLIHRRNELRAAKSLQKQLFACDNVECIWDTTVSEITGDGGVSGIKLHNVKSEGNSELQVDGVFIAVGITPNSILSKGLVDMDEQGFVAADETCTTSCDRIFVAGDIRTKQLRQIITAAADGANAVTSVERVLM